MSTELFYRTGKANNDVCWYSYGGEEIETKDFSWIVSTRNVRNERLVSNHGTFHPPRNALMMGTPHDGNGPYYSIIAKTDWGLIPGKANTQEAWYPYDWKEHSTNDFDC